MDKVDFEGVKRASIARALGVSDTTIQRWIKQDVLEKKLEELQKEAKLIKTFEPIRELKQKRVKEIKKRAWFLKPPFWSMNIIIDFFKKSNHFQKLAPSFALYIKCKMGNEITQIIRYPFIYLYSLALRGDEIW